MNRIEFKKKNRINKTRKKNERKAGDYCPIPATTLRLLHDDAINSSNTNNSILLDGGV